MWSRHSKVFSSTNLGLVRSFLLVLITSSLCYFLDNNGSCVPVLSKSLEVLLLLRSFLDG